MTEMDELPGMWDVSDLSGGWADSHPGIRMGPQEYRGVPVPDTLRPNWFDNRVEVSWWKAGVDSAKNNGSRTVYDVASRARSEKRKRACLGKYAWDDPFDALREMFALPYRMPNMTDYDLGLYRCEFCDYWHLGKMIRMWYNLEPSPIPEQVQGQIMIKYPELKDQNPAGHRNRRRDGNQYE